MMISRARANEALQKVHHLLEEAKNRNLSLFGILQGHLLTATTLLGRMTSSHPTMSLNEVAEVLAAFQSLSERYEIRENIAFSGVVAHHLNPAREIFRQIHNHFSTSLQVISMD